MKLYQKPNYEEFLVQVMYGPCTDYLAACVRTPYLDFCRTMHGFGHLKEKDDLRDEATAKLYKRFRVLAASPPKTKGEFDRWHRSCSEMLIETFRRGGFRDLHAGQAQKWINIAFKNIFVCGKNRIPGFDSVYSFCHMPIDKIVLAQLKSAGMAIPKQAWSRWSYKDYIQFQHEICNQFKGQPLLNVEHEIWIEGR